MHRQPPLQLLPPFEAAARLGSFKRAAEELHVTSSAVSQQVRALEEWLDTALFVRLTRRIELTPAGSQFYDIVSRVLREYGQQFALFRARLARPVLRVSMIPFIAHELVLPKLQDFQCLHPDIDLRIETSMNLVDFTEEPIDAAVRFGEGPWAGLASFPLCATHATLVAAPTLLHERPIQGITDIQQHTLINSRRDRDDWQQVAQRLGLAALQRKNALILDDYFSAMQAAAQGLGLAIAILPITNNWIRERRLVQVFPMQLPTEQSYQFVCRRGQTENPAIRALYQWIKTLFDALEGVEGFSPGEDLSRRKHY